MGKKLVAEVMPRGMGMATGADVARVRWDGEWEEFVVTYRGAEYHTGSRSDALGTAAAMVGGDTMVSTRRGFGEVGEA